MKKLATLCIVASLGLAGCSGSTSAAPTSTSASSLSVTPSPSSATTPSSASSSSLDGSAPAFPSVAVSASAAATTAASQASGDGSSTAATVSSRTPSAEPTTAQSTVSTTKATVPAKPVIDKAGISKSFADAFAGYDKVALRYLAPKSPAYVYVDAGIQLNAGNPGELTPTTATPIDGGYDIGPKLTDFVFDASGKIRSLKRNGVSLDKTVAISGKVITPEKTDSDTYSGSASIVVHSIRYFDTDVQVMVILRNNTSAIAHIYWSGYVSNGSQSTDAVTTTDTLPGVTRMEQARFTKTTAGGIAYGELDLDNRSHKFQVTVSPLGE